MTRPTRRRWRDKFAEAANGVRVALREQSSFVVHSLAAVLVIVFAGMLDCSALEWCVLIVCIGLVFSAEVFNCAIETLFHALDDATKARMAACLDRAAGAVLLASLAAALAGAIILGPKLLLVVRRELYAG